MLCEIDVKIRMLLVNRAEASIYQDWSELKVKNQLATPLAMIKQRNQP